MLKKIAYKTVACLCAVAVFFCSILYKPKEVYAAEIAGGVILEKICQWILLPAIGWVGGKLAESIYNDWTGKTEIRVNADGSVDVSEAQMQELKKLAEDYAQQDAGVFTYRNKSNYSSVRMWLAGFAKIDTSRFDVNVDTLDNGMSWVAWGINGHIGYITNAPVSGVWISSDASAVTFYNNTGNEAVPCKSYKCDYDGYSDGQWHDNNSNFSFYGQAQYTGADHLAFTSIDSYKNWRGGSAEVIPLTPTYSGGGVHIDKDTVNKINTLDFDTDLGKELQLTVTNNQDIDIDELQKMLDDLFQKYLKDNNLHYTKPDPTVEPSKPYTKSLLYDGAFSSGQINLLYTFKNFDIIQFDLWSSNNHDFYGACYLETDTIFLTSEISGMSYYLQPNRGDIFIWVQFLEEKKLNCSANGRASIHKIYGLKYNSTSSGGGSSGGSSESTDLSGITGVLDDIKNGIDDINKYIKKIYKQVIVGNVIDAIDAIADVIDAAINALNESAKDVEAIGGVRELLKTKFPFCLPFDAYALVCLLEAEPQAPVFEIPFVYAPLGLNETIKIDFTLFDEAIKYLRWFESFLFIWGLILLTPKMVALLNSEKGGGES